MARTLPKDLDAEIERLRSENEELRLRSEEAEQALEAIRTGQAESLVVDGPNGPRIFSLEGADHSYRVLVEAMNEGAATLAEDGTVLYCNTRFADMLDARLEQVMGSALLRFLPQPSRPAFEALVREANGGESRGELELRSQSGRAVPAYLSVSVIHDHGPCRLCLVAADLRAQKRSEEIVAAERLARSVLEQAAEAIVVCDQDGRIIRASGAAVELCGRNPLLVPFDTVFPVKVDLPFERGSGGKVASFALGGGVLRASPAVLECSDGSVADLLVSAAPLTGGADRTVGCVVTMTDISRHRQMEQDLRRSEERLSLAVSSAGMGTWDLDLSSHEAIWSETHFRMLGYEPLPGGLANAEMWRSRVHPEDLPRVLEAMERARIERSLFSPEYRIVRADDDQVVWLRVFGRFQYDERGEAVRFAGVFFDNSDRKRAEEALRSSESLLRAIMEAVPDPVFLKDPEGHMLLANPATFEVIGKSAERVLGRTDREFYDDPETGEALMANDRRIMKAGRAEAVEETALTPSGPRVFLSAKAPCRGPDGRIIGIVGVARDITERKRIETALEDANQRLREEDQRKNDFLATLSHELRNPLAPINNSLYILERAVPGGEQARRALSVIDRQVGQLARLVDDLLDVTRVTRNKVQLKFERLDLNEVVRRTVEDHRSLFDQSGVRLDTTFESAPVMVNADGARMAQVVGNLLTNSAKFTPRGGSTRVGVARDGDVRQAMVRVADTGAGMSEEILARLFKPFCQADQTLDRSKGGLGLGLALVKGLVEQHFGEVSAHSAGLGHGAEFIVRLPLDATAAAVVLEPATGAQGARRILVIEDNVDAADSLREVLEFEGHEVEVAYSGPEGLKAARQCKPDLVLCDIGLPGMDGYEVAHAFRADEALKRVHLVALTGYAMPEDLARAERAGFERHLAKPPSLEKIEEALGDCR